MAKVRLCAGIDPSGSGWEEFSRAVTLHDEVLARSPSAPSVLKPNLAFFLAQGSRGLALLEGHVARHREAGREIVLDCKCNEIANSLEAWLRFAFVSLGATGVTVNAFLGEKTISLALEAAAKHAGEKGRVYVLCATSEWSQGPLAYMQEHPARIVAACRDARERVVGAQFPHLAGVVVGANRSDVLFSEALGTSGLSVLAPGLGAQGASWEVVDRCRELSGEATFPVSRGIFRGGSGTIEEALASLESMTLRFA